MDKNCEKCLLRTDQNISDEEIQLLTQYIPYRVSRLIGESDCCIFEHTVEKLEGTVIYFDIIGFTSIIVNYINTKRDIADLSGTFSEFYSVVIETVRGLGGSIFQFAGDSLLIAFEKFKDESDTDNFKRAFAAMLRSLELADNYNSVTGKANGFSLRPKIGIASGTFYQLLLGSQNQYITSAIAGPAVKDAIACEETCTKQEIVISSGTYSVASNSGLADCFTGQTGFFHLSSFPENFLDSVVYPDYFSVEDLFTNPRYYNRLSIFLNPAVIQQIRSSVHGFSGEYKDITCIMVQFDGQFAKRLGSEDIGASFTPLNEVNKLMQQKASRYGGFSLNPDLSDKGVVFPVLFGTPSAIENKERNALLCTIEIIEESKKISDISSVHAGIATGMVYSGEFGGYLRKDYTVIGNSVNFASRLMTYVSENTPYVILFDEQTKKEVDNLCLSEAISGIQCKGYEGSQTAYRFNGMRVIRQTHRIEMPIIGRDAELKMLQHSFNKAINGHFTFIPIIGEAGLGKSFLAERFVEQTVKDNSDTQFFFGTAFQYEESTPLFCWSSVIKNLLQISDATPVAITENMLTLFFSEHFPEQIPWIPFLLNMIGYNVSESSLTSGMEATAKQHLFFSFIYRLLLLFSKKSTLIIVLEDIQWADEVSLKLLDYLMTSPEHARILIIPIARETPPIVSFFSSKNISIINLNALKSDDASLLASNLLNLETEQPLLLEKIISVSDGNPLFIESIIENLVENGTIIATESGKRKLSVDEKDIPNIVIPSSIQNIILSRLTSLAFNEQVVCKTASAIGKTFFIEYLSALLPENISESAMKDMLSDFETHNLIVKSDKDKEYSFTNITVHDVIYNTILDTTKKELNRMIISYLEDKYRNDQTVVSERLLYHAQEANDYDRVFKYARICADKAFRQFAVNDAVSLYQTAILAWDKLESSPDIEVLYHIQLSLGDTYRASGNYEAAEENFSMLASNCKNKSISADALRGLGRCYQEQGKFEKAVSTLEKALALLGKKAPVSKVGVYSAICREAISQFFILGIAKKKIKQFSGKKLEKAKTRTDILCILSKLYYFGLPEKIAWSSIANFNNTLRFTTDNDRCCIASGDYAVSLDSAGFTTLGKNLFENGYALLHSLSPFAASIIKSRYAYYFLFHNNPKRSIELLEESSEYFRKSGEKWELMTAVGALAQNYFLIGDFDKSLVAYTEAQSLGEKLHSNMHIGWAYNKIPFMRYLRGELSGEQAEQQLLEGIKLSESVHDHMTLCIHYGHLATIAVREQHPEKALEYAQAILHENRIYRINIPHVKISYGNAVEAVCAALSQNKTSISRQAQYIALAKHACKKIIKLSKKFGMLEGPAYRAAAALAIIYGDKANARILIKKSITVLRDSPYAAEYAASQQFAEEYALNEQ